jgi:uncharacterized membrane protein
MRAVVLAFIIVCLAINPLLFSEDFYTHLQAGEYIELESRVTRDTIEYFTNDEYGPMSTDYFTNREADHMLDVKLLIHIGFLCYAIGLLYLLHNPKQTWNAIPQACCGLLCAILGLALLPFNLVFTYFHHLFFTKDTWMFPASSNLLAAFPIHFFYNFTVTIVAIIVLICLTSLATHYASKIISRREKRP